MLRRDNAGCGIVSDQLHGVAVLVRAEDDGEQQDADEREQPGARGFEDLQRVPAVGWRRGLNWSGGHASFLDECGRSKVPVRVGAQDNGLEVTRSFASANDVHPHGR